MNRVEMVTRPPATWHETQQTDAADVLKAAANPPVER